MGENHKLAALEERLGWTFRDRSRLLEALTHSTYANENADGGCSNERLEFLGDAVLGLLAARVLFEQLADEPEGELTRRRALVVRQEALASMAQELDLGAHLRLGQGQRGCGSTASGSILADAFEAVIGAVFLDGGWVAVESCFAAQLGRSIENATESVDHKTRLQEECHRLGRAAPLYRVVATHGPDHARRYTCEVTIEGESFGQSASLPSKKVAEQECARQALARLAAKS